MNKNFKGDKRRMMELAGIPFDVTEDFLKEEEKVTEEVVTEEVVTEEVLEEAQDDVADKSEE